MIRIAIGLGTNLGDRRGQLDAAARALFELAQPGSFRLASLYETPPLGPPQPDFLNSAVSLVTPLDPHAVLAHVLSLEAIAGRVRRERWGPRTLDLDLLSAIDEDGVELSIDSPQLTLPHPELTRRSFALAPLLEVMAELSPRYAPALAALGPLPTVVARPKRGSRGGYKGWTASARVP